MKNLFSLVCQANGANWGCCLCFTVNMNITRYLFQERLDNLMRLWELLLMQSAEKGRMLLFTQKRVHFIRECSEVLMWIADRVSIEMILADQTLG